MAIVANDTSPVKESITEQETGLLTDFFYHAQLVKKVGTLQDAPEQSASLGQNAPAFVKAEYDLNSICIPNHLTWVDQLVQPPLKIFSKTKRWAKIERRHRPQRHPVLAEKTKRRTSL